MKPFIYLLDDDVLMTSDSEVPPRKLPQDTICYHANTDSWSRISMGQHQPLEDWEIKKVWRFLLLLA